MPLLQPALDRLRRRPGVGALGSSQTLGCDAELLGLDSVVLGAASPTLPADVTTCDATGAEIRGKDVDRGGFLSSSLLMKFAGICARHTGQRAM